MSLEMDKCRKIRHWLRLHPSGCVWSPSCFERFWFILEILIYNEQTSFESRIEREALTADASYYKTATSMEIQYSSYQGHCNARALCVEKVNKHMAEKEDKNAWLFNGLESVRIVKNCDLGRENVSLSRPEPANIAWYGAEMHVYSAFPDHLVVLRPHSICLRKRRSG